MNKPIQKLNARQRQCIELEIAHPRWKPTELAKELKVSSQTIWNWQHSPVYIDQLDKRLREEFKSACKIASETLVNLAQEGDREAAKYILKCGSYEPAEKQEVSLTTNAISIKITGNDD